MDPNMNLLYHALQSALDLMGTDETNPEAWLQARNSLGDFGVGEEDDADLFLAIECEDRDALAGILTGWTSGERLMLERDRAVLKRAMKAYRKRLKITVLDAESTVGGSPMSTGRESDIVGIVPPERYPHEVWDELVRQKRLVADRFGTYELPPGG